MKFTEEMWRVIQWLEEAYLTVLLFSSTLMFSEYDKTTFYGFCTGTILDHMDDHPPQPRPGTQ